MEDAIQIILIVYKHIIDFLIDIVFLNNFYVKLYQSESRYEIICKMN